ncbi:MAG: hypothetical protein H7239_11305 [Flavobacterium sp.]|nr:hypothetical protein [Flavobacterium sp.]
MRRLFVIFIVGMSLFLVSCRKDFAFEASNGGLEFSKQTVYLDTVFTNIGSSTYRLKVYNRSSKDISIPKVQLGKGTNSKYRITVDGLTGDAGAQNKIFTNVPLLAKDSLFIFVEVTSDVANANPTDFLYTDTIDFYNASSAPQQVNLITLIQDAIFIKPDKPLSTGIKETLSIQGLEGVEGHVLTTPSELNWTSTKPYVIYGYAAVPNGSTLTIGAGTSVYFHANSGLVIDNQAKINVNGSLNVLDSDGKIITKNEVTFEGDRLEPDFENVPGQWGTVLLFSSLNNTIDHLTLKNSVIGLYIQSNNATSGSPNLTITNSQIYNNANFGILGIDATITGKNLVINSAGQSSFAGTYGGNYNFSHCTFNNNFNNSKQKAVLLTNYLVLDDGTLTPPNPLNQSNFTDCILYGNNQTEIALQQNGGVFNYQFTNCIIKFNSQVAGSGLYDFNSTNYSGSNIATNSSQFNPNFKNANQNKLWPTQDISQGSILNPIKDILDKLRTSGNNNVGAYQTIPN